MQVQEAQVQELTQDPDNSRSHDRKNLEAIKQSLEAFGQQKPIVIDQEGKVVAGNGTLAAAQELGWQTIQAVVTDLEGAKQTAYAIADNRTAELAAWNDQQLAKSLVSLQNDQSIDEAISGFRTDEIERMVGAFDIDTTALPELADGEKEPFQQIAFRLHDSQAEAVHEALRRAADEGMATSDVNTNKNGNAIAAICMRFLDGVS